MDQDKNDLLQRYTGASISLASLYETLSEIQIFTLNRLWPEGSKELDAAADTIEGVKALLVNRNNQIKKAAEGILNGDSEE